MKLKPLIENMKNTSRFLKTKTFKQHHNCHGIGVQFTLDYKNAFNTRKHQNPESKNRDFKKGEVGVIHNGYGNPTFGVKFEGEIYNIPPEYLKIISDNP